MNGRRGSLTWRGVSLCILFVASRVSAGELMPGAGSSTSTPELTRAFTEFRLAFANRPGYFGSWVQDPQREAVSKALEDKRVADFMTLSAAWLGKCPTDARIHLARASELSKSGDVVSAAYHRMMFYGLLMSIISSGDGRSKDSAYKVISADEEYTLMNYLGAQLKEQKLEGHYDVLKVELNGNTTTMYFDITIPLRAMAEQLQGKGKP